ncbi:MAG: signal recognition particle-docking protein FtsY [Spirochaetales bacterium]|nr:signal recognition particle-docking protein FtsY [Spirochaetales bacterium]
MIKTLTSRLRTLLKGSSFNKSFFEELEDILIEGDVGAQIAMEVVDQLRSGSPKNETDLRGELKKLMLRHLKSLEVHLSPDSLNFFLVLGVNGVGKTTSLAKLANHFRATLGPEKILLGAGDTFRAGAIDQIKILGDRIGLRVVHQEQGADAGSVIFDSLASGLSREMRLVIADTAGRMHNKQNLVRELGKIDGIVRRKIGSGTYHRMLVIDATTGQNGLRQAEVFDEAIGVDSVFLAKYDSTSKGGIAIAISKNLGIPVSFIGTGEALDDIEPFDSHAYLDELLGAE